MTSKLPDPDLVIRTSGEKRLSNFLLWQIAYSELYFTKTLWPDFNTSRYSLALRNYVSRKRRFGGLTCIFNIENNFKFFFNSFFTLF